MTHTKLILTFLLFIFLSTNLFAQVTQEWLQRYNGPGNGYDYARSIAVDDSGNVFVTGGSEGDYITIKYNSNGDTIWVRRYNGTVNGTDVASSIAVDDSGNAYVTGYSAGTNNYDIVTIKYNTFGVQQWIQRYNEPADYWNYAYASALDDSGNVYVTGMRGSIASGCNNVITIKYNSYGVQQWVQIWYKEYPGYYQIAEARSIAVRESGVYVTGTCLDSADYRIVTIKYSTGGTQQWSRVYYSSIGWEDKAFSIAVDGSGNAYVTGQSMRWLPIINDEYITIKYNAGGSQQWVKLYNGPGNGNDCARSNVVDDSGNVYVTGSSPGIGTGNDYATIKYNTSGTQQWVQRYNGPGNGSDGATSIAMDDYGNVYVTGSSVGSGTGSDYATVKYNSAGAQKWVQRYNGPGNNGDGASSLVLDGFDSVYVTGSSTGLGTGSDFATIKYSIQPPILNAFNLSTPPNGSQIKTSPYNDSLVHMKWTHSGAGATYKWKFGSPTIANPLLTYEANNLGYDSLFSIKNSNLDSALASLGVLPGEVKIGEWAVWAYNGIDSLKSTQTWDMTLRRRNVSILFYDPFSTGTGKWTITGNVLNRDRINCVWQIFSEPYFNPYSLPPSSVSPVFSADGGRCGYSSSTMTTATVANNINCSGYGNISLEFDNDWNAKPIPINHHDSAIVDASYDGGITWTRIISWGRNDVRCSHEFKFLPGAANIPNLKVRFRSEQNWTGTNPSWWTIDNVLILGELGTGFPIPVAPVLVSPANGAILVATNPLLDWDSSTYAESYKVQVSTDSLFTSTVYDSSNITITEFQIPNNGLNINTTYYWKVNATNIIGTSPWSTIFHFTTGTTNITHNNEVPKEFKLYNSYPNPFNPSTKIKFDIPKSSYVKLIVYDVLGREIKTLVNEKLNAGRYQVNWDGSGYPSGVYIYKLLTGDFVNVKKMVLLK